MTDARYLWDNGLVGIIYEKDSGVGLQRILLELQHYWAISPLSLLEHKNETVKRTHKELGCMGSYHVILTADSWINKVVEILNHYLWHRLCSFIVKTSNLLSKFYLKLEAMKWQLLAELREEFAEEEIPSWIINSLFSQFFSFSHQISSIWKEVTFSFHCWWDNTDDLSHFLLLLCI